MIAFIQPFGLNSPGGGPRILRSLVHDAPAPYLSVCTAARPPEEPHEQEIHLSLRPYFGRLEHTRLARYLQIESVGYLFSRRFKRELRQICIREDVSAIHAIPHGLSFWYAFEVAEELGLPYYLNVHDELAYNLRGYSILPFTQEKLADVWPQATGRIVISEAMGAEYCRRYGDRPYEIITDGLNSVAPAPRRRPLDSLRVYFMGSIHMSYESNFDALFRALSRLHGDGVFDTVSLTTRPGFSFPVDTRGVPLDVRPWGTQEDINRDLDTADVLYFPLPFEPEYAPFVRYSLSTKLVTYLGTGLPILYHGPEQAAAGQLLAQHEAALQTNSLDPDQMARRMERLPATRNRIVTNALDLADARFRREDQRRRFWSTVRDHAPGETEPA